MLYGMEPFEETVYLSRVRMEEGMVKASCDWVATPASLITPHQCYDGALLCTPHGLWSEGVEGWGGVAEDF